MRAPGHTCWNRHFHDWRLPHLRVKQAPSGVREACDFERPQGAFPVDDRRGYDHVVNETTRPVVNLDRAAGWSIARQQRRFSLSLRWRMHVWAMSVCSRIAAGKLLNVGIWIGHA